MAVATYEYAWCTGIGHCQELETLRHKKWVQSTGRCFTLGENTAGGLPSSRCWRACIIGQLSLPFFVKFGLKILQLQIFTAGNNVFCLVNRAHSCFIINCQLIAHSHFLCHSDRTTRLTIIVLLYLLLRDYFTWWGVPSLIPQWVWYT